MSDKDNQSSGTPVEPFPTFAALRARHSELLELDAESDGEEIYLADVEEFFKQVQATGSVLTADEERRTSQSILNYWTTVLYRADRKPSNTTLAELDPEFKPRLYDELCPYPGVREFNENEGKYFFGRQRAIDYLVARLKVENYLALVGPSGSGKSSLVRAGLIPAIKSLGLGEEDPSSEHRHFLPIVTPGSDPLANLAVSLAGGRDQSSEALEEYQNRLRRDQKFLLSFLDDQIGSPAVIVVDQFEELFILCRNRDARRMFLQNILALENSKHRVIVCTSREDLQKGLKKIPEFEKVFERGRTLVPRLGASELSEAITKPADLVGFKIREQTVKDIVQEISTLPVGLPLLQFTLIKLWEKRGTHDEYFARVGGCRQLLTESADEFLRDLKTREERRLAERMFRRMIEFEYKYQSKFVPVQLDTKARPVTFRELADEVGPSEQVSALVERATRAQLLRRSASVSPEDEQLELVHQSLIHNWLPLSNWVARQKSRRFKVATAMAASLLVVGLAVLVFAALEGKTLWDKQKARDRSGEWAETSRKHLSNRRLDGALLFGLAAYLTDPSDDNVDARSAFLATLLFRPRPKAFLWQAGTGDVAFSPDGRLLAANDHAGRITFWDVSGAKPFVRGESIHDPPSENSQSEDEIAPLAFSNDGNWLVSGGDGSVTIWDVADRKQFMKFTESKAGKITAISLSSDNRRLAALGRDIVVIWDVGTPDPLSLPIRAQERITAIALSNDGGTLAAGDENGNVELWDIDRKRLMQTLATCECIERLAETRNVISSVAFSPDDQLVAVSGSEETVLWSAKGESLKRLSPSHGRVGMVLSFSQDGRTLAGFEGDRQVYLWDMETRREIGPGLFRPIGSTASLAFSGDARTLAARGERGITLYDLSDSERPLVGHNSYITDLAFSPDGSVVASSGNDGAVNLWNAASGQAIGKLQNEDRSSALSLAFSHSKGLLAAGLYNGKILLASVADLATAQLDSGVRIQDESALLVDQSALAFTPDDQTLVSVTAQGREIRVEAWNVSEKKPRDGANSITLKEGRGVTALALSPDGKHLAVATDQKELLVWNIAENRVTPTTINHPWPEITRTLEFSPSGRWLYFGGDDHSRVFRADVSASTPEVTIFFTAEPQGVIADVAFSTDERTIAVAVNPVLSSPTITNDADIGLVMLVDVNNSRAIGDILRGQRSQISALAFSKNHALATAGQDLTVVLWDVDTCAARKRICEVIPFEFADRFQIMELYNSACLAEPVERKECAGRP